MIGHGQLCCIGGHVAILQDHQIEILCVSAYNDTFCTFICQPTLLLYFKGGRGFMKHANTALLTACGFLNSISMDERLVIVLFMW